MVIGTRTFFCVGSAFASTSRAMRFPDGARVFFGFNLPRGPPALPSNLPYLRSFSRQKQSSPSFAADLGIPLSFFASFPSLHARDCPEVLCLASPASLLRTSISLSCLRPPTSPFRILTQGVPPFVESLFAARTWLVHLPPFTLVGTPRFLTIHRPYAVPSLCTMTGRLSCYLGAIPDFT